MLDDLAPFTGKDDRKYRNHVHRVYLNCSMIDEEEIAQEKYAVAAVFHDIGIWTNGSIDYLLPSMAQAKAFLLTSGHLDWIEEVQSMIYWHHKTGAYQGNYQRTVETFRKADWIDVSLGFLNFGEDSQLIAANRRRYPNAGFHWFLCKKIIRNFFKHPLNPLPMFKS